MEAQGSARPEKRDRRRAAAACGECDTRKTKCDLESSQPCSKCRLNGRVCQLHVSRPGKHDRDFELYAINLNSSAPRRYLSLDFSTSAFCWQLRKHGRLGGASSASLQLQLRSAASIATRGFKTANAQSLKSFPRPLSLAGGIEWKLARYSSCTCQCARK